APPAHRRAVPLSDVCRRISRERASARQRARQTGGDRGLGAQPALSGGRHYRVSARSVSPGSHARGGDGHPPVSREGCTRGAARRSEEHTSELQSPYDLVCRLLLEKKKKKKHR